ncbi:AMP-binding protein [Pendulispora albinea]|uniref:AMP-binding protein n=1 Tax=Pendulispora albinea TaxID=2741071 RepID=A0ABZ2LPL8_9BACT
MTPTQAFERARDILIKHREDLDRARAEFRWPELGEFNWAWDWFEVLAQRNDKPAIHIVRDSGEVRSATYRELADRSTRLARWLTDHGVARGDRILVMLTNVMPLWETVLAAMKIGAVIIPATPQLTPDDVDDRIARGNVRHMVTDPDGARKLRNPERLGVKLAVGGAPSFTLYEDALNAPASLARVPTRATDPLLLYFTSGTTAKPKLVLHTHGSYPVGHLTTMYWLGLRESDVHENISSPGWAKHAWSSFFAPWNAGATILMHDASRFSAKRTLEILHEHGVSTMCAPPTVWRMLVLESLGKKPSELRELASAGEPLNPEIIETVRAAWGITVRDGYGQTETTAQVGNSPGLYVKLGSMGRPLPGYEVVLLDSEGREVDEGEVALKLSPRPTGLMVGYLDDEQRDRAAMAGGYYRTGDEARIDDDGYIHFVGRGDDVFKSSDYRISPFELESVLLEHHLVAEAAVVPSPDPLRLSVPKAFVVLVPGVPETAETARSIFEFCNDRLAAYNRVRRLEFASLPKTISGKIRRVELRKLEASRREKNERAVSEFWLDEVIPRGEGAHSVSGMIAASPASLGKMRIPKV